MTTPSLGTDARTTILAWARHRPLVELARELVRVDLGVTAPERAHEVLQRLLTLLPTLESGDSEALMLASRGWEMLVDPVRAFQLLERVAPHERGVWHLHRFARLAHLAGDTATARQLFDALVARTQPGGAPARTIGVADARIAPTARSAWDSAPRADAALHVHHDGRSGTVRVPLIADDVEVDRLEAAEVVGRYLFPIDEQGTAQTLGQLSDVPLLLEQDHWVLDTVDEVGRSVHIAACNAHGLLLHVPRPRTRRIARALLLGQFGDANYFHWMAECLPRVALLEHVEDADTLPLLIGGPLRAWQADALRLFGVDPARVVSIAPDESVMVDELWLVRSSFPHSALAESSARFLSRAATPKRTGTGRRLYLARGERMRSVVNEAAVLERYQRADFEFVRPELLSLREQIALFGEAGVVAGVVGASFTGLAFAPPGTRAIASNMRLYLGPCYVALAHWMGQEIHAVVGTEVESDVPHPHWDYTLDLDDVDRAIAAAVA